MANGTLKVQNIETSSGSGTITLGQSGETLALGASNISGFGKIGQVIQDATSTEVQVSTNTYTDLGLSVAITPSSTNSKILVMYSVQVNFRNAESGGGGIRLKRGSTVIHNPPTDSNGPFQFYIQDSNDFHATINVQYLDSPASTSQQTYTLEGRRYNSGLIRFTFDADINATSTLTAMEILG